MLDAVVFLVSDTGQIVQQDFAHRVLKIETGGARAPPALLLWGMP
jgi:hypothetical protein